MTHSSVAFSGSNPCPNPLIPKMINVSISAFFAIPKTAPAILFAIPNATSLRDPSSTLARMCTAKTTAKNTIAKEATAICFSDQSTFKLNSDAITSAP